MADADAAFVKQEGLDVSIKTIYRRWAAYKSKNWDDLVDKRGQCNRGRSEAPKEIRDLFEYFYLDERALNIKKCYEITQMFLRQERPELLPQLPSYATAYRWAMAMSSPVACLAREGDKAFNDRYGIFVDRLYDDMISNDYWIADGHRFDVITKSEDGKERMHRLTLSAFIDARSGIYVGWVITENPNSDATLLALRKAIMRYGIPRYLYVDNGREYLNIDIGGMGHRTRSRKVEIKLPTPILSRLGITMTNALPRNAQAKTIEREFRNMTFLSQLFGTWVGSNVVVKPEKLKANLKNGKIPTDSELYGVVESMIEGYFNCQPYNGKVVADHGKTKIEVFHEYLPNPMRMAEEKELNLMMMRSTRLQTVGRNGVHVTISGEKIYYFDDELLMMQGRQVYVRYDPEDMREVRLYDENEAVIKTAPLRSDIIETYFANKEGLQGAMREKRRWRRKAKEAADLTREKVVSQYGHINALDILVRAANINREGLLTPTADVIELVRPDEVLQRLAATGTDGGVVIDRARMIQNNERE
jgi:transposase InsO family protein